MPLHIRCVLALGALLILLPRCRTLAPQQVDRILDEQRRDQHLPAVALAIVKDGRVVYSRMAGLRDIEHNLPVTADTLFPIGSCTKSFTSMAIALARDRGLLSLDDPPRRFLPWFRMADPDADAQVTLRDMLSHRTGLKAYADLAAETAVLNREEYIRAATSAKPAVKFRTAFQYSNAMYTAAGEIAGRANGTTWERVIERQIFDPLEMRSSVTSAKRIVSIEDHVTGYVYDAAARTFRPVAPPASLELMAPAGNIASTLGDMTQWLRMLTSGGTIDGRRFVSEEMFREVTTPVIAINSSMSYALGWATYDWNGLRVVEHNGGSQGISALVSFIPERRTGFVFLANTSPSSMTRIGNAGKLLYPVIFNVTATSATVPVKPAEPKTNASETADARAVDALLERMIDASGGENVLRRHTSLEIHARKAYENQGVTADLTVQQRAPAIRNDVEIWTAAGKEIGRLRVFFDGAHGGQETTFGQDEINDADANARARIENSFHPLLELKTLYKAIAVRGASKAGGEDVWIVELTPEHGSPARLFVSQRTALVVQRESEGQTVEFAGYREVDGEPIPFLTTIHDALGETTITIEAARFNAPIADAAFR